MPQHWRWLEFQKVEAPNTKRYYRIEIAQTADGWTVTTFRSRIGQKPRPMIETFPTFEAARERARRRMHDRLLHGYALVPFGM
jgi:predicted DNA-binding WGR domain protein